MHCFTISGRGDVARGVRLEARPYPCVRLGSKEGNRALVAAGRRDFEILLRGGEYALVGEVSVIRTRGKKLPLIVEAKPDERGRIALVHVMPDGPAAISGPEREPLDAVHGVRLLGLGYTADAFEALVVLQRNASLLIRQVVGGDLRRLVVDFDGEAVNASLE